MEQACCLGDDWLVLAGAGDAVRGPAALRARSVRLLMVGARRYSVFSSTGGAQVGLLLRQRPVQFGQDRRSTRESGHALSS